MQVKPTYIIILVLLALLVLQHQCSTPVEPQIIVERDTTYITEVRVDSYPDPYPVYVEHIRWDTITKIDTVLILGDYFSVKTFRKRYEFGDTLSIEVTDSISRNTLTKQIIKYDLNIPVIREKITIITNQHELYVGPKLNLSANVAQMGIDITYRSPYKNLYTVYYSPSNNTIGFGVQWRIFKRTPGESLFSVRDAISPL